MSDDVPHGEIPPPLDLSDLLTVAEVAQMLRLSPVTIRKAIRAGALATVRVGRRALRIRRRELHVYLYGLRGR